MGYLPNVKDIDTTGLDITEATMQALLAVNNAQWQGEIAAIGEYLSEFGDRMPQAMKDELGLEL
ncbi:MAG: phosphoenolpyruvate carboxykinase (GTP) [Chloroflexi bacterium]|nr:phosphoenolpyruvate carboxykinase (GTP) [Chloroflexota bacterium]